MLMKLLRFKDISIIIALKVIGLFNLKFLLPSKSFPIHYSSIILPIDTV
jgi:hypothetical protein